MPGIEDIRLASANDPMDDKNQISLQLFGKPLDQLNEDEIIELDLWLEDKAQKWQGNQGGRAGYQTGGTTVDQKLQPDYIEQLKCLVKPLHSLHKDKLKHNNSILQNKVWVHSRLQLQDKILYKLLLINKQLIQLMD